MRIRIVGGIADGQMWEGHSPVPTHFQRHGYVTPRSGQVGSLEEKMSATLESSTYILQILYGGSPQERLYVYADSKLTLAQIIQRLCECYCPIAARVGIDGE